MLPMSDAYGMSVVLSVSVVVQRLIDGSMGDVTDCPDDMLNCFVMVLMNEGCEICIIPSSWFLLIWMLSNQLGSPRSDISKLPLRSLIIQSMAFWELVLIDHH